MIRSLFLALAFALALPSQAQQVLDDLAALWQSPESRCAPYDRGDYPYSQSLEQRIAEYHGFGMTSPYDGTVFSSLRESDIEHIVATSEAHDSGMCTRPSAEKARFAQDLDNLTLASPDLNRYVKRAKDAGEWLPDLNRCWYAARVVAVKRAYSLTVDEREYAALQGVLMGCGSPVFAESGELPGAVALLQNYPNPFNPATEIEYELSAPERVRLEVFDAAGRSTGVLVNGMRPAGRHSVRFDASGLPSGLYAYRMQAGTETRVRKMILVR